MRFKIGKYRCDNDHTPTFYESRINSVLHRLGEESLVEYKVFSNCEPWEDNGVVNYEVWWGGTLMRRCRGRSQQERREARLAISDYLNGMYAMLCNIERGE